MISPNNVAEAPLDPVTKPDRILSETLRNTPISWYRSPIAPKDLRALSRPSDWLGLKQALSHIGLVLLAGTVTVYSIYHWPAWATVLMFLLYGSFCGFLGGGAAVHELMHGTVFRSEFLNSAFLRVFAFFSWTHFIQSQLSHTRHHRYTLHPPDDLEGIGPLTWRKVFEHAFMNLPGPWNSIKTAFRLARSRFEGDWELFLVPESNIKVRKQIAGWARTLLIGHGLIIALSIFFGLWWLPLLTTFCSFYGGWLVVLATAPQHFGLPDHAPDFRVCCRTYTVNPLVELLYWHMNYHIEHHMYPSVPCYNLGKLHRLIKHDLPPCPHGLIATWIELNEIMQRKKADPAYCKDVLLPAASA